MQNVQLERAYNNNPTFQAIEQELQHKRQMQKAKWRFIVPIDGEVTGQATTPFNVTLQAPTYFVSDRITGSAFSFDGANASDFPMPNSLDDGTNNPRQDWQARGLSIKITDTSSSRVLTQDFVSFELLCSPGFGVDAAAGMPFPYVWRPDSKIQIDVRNSDVSTRTCKFWIAIHGFKYLVPNIKD